MGPKTFLELFKQVFEDQSENAKYSLAPMFYPYYEDVKAKLLCLEPCDDVTDRIAAIDHALTEMDPFLTPGGGGGGGGGS